MKNKIELIPVNEFGSEITVGGYGFDKFIEKPKQLTDLEIAIKLEEIEREEVRAVNRTDLYNYILSIVKQIPRANVESDAMDAPGCAYEIEKLFYKWQQEKMYSEEDLREAFRQGMENMDYSEMYGFDSKLTEQEWFDQFKKK